MSEWENPGSEVYARGYSAGRASFERDLAASGKVVVDRDLLARLIDHTNELSMVAQTEVWPAIRVDYEAALAVLRAQAGGSNV